MVKTVFVASVLTGFVSFAALNLFVEVCQARPMPANFCRELRHIDRRTQPLTYRDTKEACIWDWNNPIKR